MPIWRSRANANAQNVKALKNRCAKSACTKPLVIGVEYSRRATSQKVQNRLRSMINRRPAPAD